MAVCAHDDHVDLQLVCLRQNGLYRGPLHQERGSVNAFILELFRSRLDLPALVMKGVGPPVSYMLGTNRVSNKIGIGRRHVE